MRKLLLVCLAALSATFVVSPPLTPDVGAQGAISVVSNQPTNEFPKGVLFAITFNAPAPIQEVRLQYQLAPDGTGATAVATCTGSGSDATAPATPGLSSCSYMLASGAGISIIPGAQITYHWDITDTAGDKLSTPDELYVHTDTRFTFGTLTSENVTLYYRTGLDTQAAAVLAAAVDTLHRVGQLEKTQVTFPVKVFLYETAEEMQPSIASGGTGRGVVVLGEVVYSDTAMVSADVATLDITRHEVAHLVTREAMKGPYNIPAWLNEGISVYSQAQPLAGHAQALQAAISSNTVLSVKELNSSASGSVAATVGLYYGEAGSIVKFLVESEGADKFAQLLSTVKAGSTFDNALQTVYGFDSLGMENAWRGSVGLPPRLASATATPQATGATRGLVTPQTTGAGAQTASGSSGTSSTTIAIIVGLAAALLAAVAAAAFVVLRRM